MTRYTDEELSYLDVSWFLVDINNTVGIFATSGVGNIFNRQSVSKEDLEVLYDYIDSLQERTEAIAEEYVDVTVLNPRRVVSEYELRAARQGLYIYERRLELGYDPNIYIRTAYPREPLKLEEVPEELRKLLSAMRSDKINLSISQRINILDG